MTSDIRALINIISAQVDTIEAKYAKAGESCPSLDQPEPTFGTLDHDPEVDRAKDIATAAAAQLLASLRSPLDTVYEMHVAHFRRRLWASLARSILPIS